MRGRFAYDISLDRNYSTKREKFHHRILGRCSGTGDVLVAAAAILYGLTIVTEDKRVTPGEVARWQRWMLVFMRSYC
jgi:predicted nucleic acid-binding protein